MVYLLLGLGIISRLVPHAANFTAIGAIGLFAGKKLGVWRAMAVVLLAMVITDIFLGFSNVTPFVYAGMAGYAIVSLLIKNKISIVYSAVLGSVFFFIITNFGVWLGPWYPHNLAGLTDCFVKAIPFFRGTLESDVILSVAAFSIYAIVERARGKRLILSRVQQTNGV